MSDPRYENIGDPRDKVIEEGSELIREVTVLIQEICKARRFGIFSSHPTDQPEKPNIIRILDEMADMEKAISSLRVLLLDNIRDIPELADQLSKYGATMKVETTHDVDEDYRVDVAGNRMYLGDKVAMIQADTHSLKFGTVHKLTPKGVTVKRKWDSKTNGDGKFGLYPRGLHQVVRVPNITH